MIILILAFPVIFILGWSTIRGGFKGIIRFYFNMDLLITKPFEQTELLNVVRKAVETCKQSKKEPVLTENDQESVSGISKIIGSSAQIQEIFKTIAKVARSSATILIFGESGTGKELVAFELHRQSDRADKPFIKVNCAAIPETLIESELFGYEKGAFTGATTSKPGRFELAHEGTLFLDEVAEMTLEMQVKLLRVLQEQEFERVGGITSVRVNTRIIAATNKELSAEIKAGRFREDLFYRLNVVPITLPPLRERKEDLDLLIRYFMNRFQKKFTKNVNKIEPECLFALKNYSWPGNIRQLENVMERMMIMCEGDALRVEDLPEEVAGSAGVRISVENGKVDDLANFKEIVRKQTQSVERELIEKALEETNGNITRAAEKLGLSRKGLQLKLKELGVKRPVE